jgi:ATP-dependent protease Clp ATPase subunit
MEVKHPPSTEALNCLHPKALTLLNQASACAHIMRLYHATAGNTTSTATATHDWNLRVPTPRELMAALDQYVIGQTHAKKVLPQMMLC